jgi:hypothetical protein
MQEYRMGFVDDSLFKLFYFILKLFDWCFITFHACIYLWDILFTFHTCIYLWDILFTFHTCIYLWLWSLQRYRDCEGILNYFNSPSLWDHEASYKKCFVSHQSIWIPTSCSGRDHMELDLQLPMQSVPITTNVVSSNPAQARCSGYNIMW